MFDSEKVLRQEKNVKEYDFLMVGCLMKNIKENWIWIKLVRNVYIFKWFNLYIEELKKSNEFKVAYKNNLLTLNKLFILFYFFFLLLFFSICSLLQFSLNFLITKHSLNNFIF